jgi:hypothetical protein
MKIKNGAIGGNGRQYRAVPTKKSQAMSDVVGSKNRTVAERSNTTAHTVHQKVSRSKTLLRSAIKRPTPAPGAVSQRSPLIRKFAEHPQKLKSLTISASKVKFEEKPIKRSSERLTPAQKQITSRTLKEQLIKEKLAEVSDNPARSKRRSLKELFLKRPKLNIAAALAAILLLGGYLAYINMPNLSVRVASARAGIPASFPEYHPDGYRFSGPVTYSPGEVELKFSSNTNDQTYVIKQQASNWDSQAVLDNHVTRQSSNYLTYSEQGLTIFTFGNKAAWVNGGVLYTIDGTAPLSSEQILKIAASM